MPSKDREIITVRVDSDVKKAFAIMAERAGRSMSKHAEMLIERYLLDIIEKSRISVSDQTS